MYEQNQPSLMNLFGTVLIFMVAAAYGFITLSTEDALWFVPTYSEQAAEASIYCKGVETVLFSDTSHLAILNDQTNTTISGTKTGTRSQCLMKHTNTIDQQYRYGVGDRIHEQSPNTLLLRIFFQPGFNRNSPGWASLRHKRNFWALQWIFNSRIIALQRNAPDARFC